MSGVAEASLVLGLISSIIAIYEGAHEIYEAASDVKGLPRKFQLAAEQIPLVLHALGLAEQNIKGNAVSPDALQSAKPILERCKESAAEVKDIFDKTIPSKDASRTERYKKAVGIKLKSKKVKESMEEVVKNMELLVQHQVFQDAETLKYIQDAVEQLSHLPDDEPPSQFAHSGAGPLNVHQGMGNLESYSHSGSGHINKAETQYIGTNPVHHHYPPREKADFSFRKPVGPEDQSPQRRQLVLGGPGGIGKTQLAVAYAQRQHQHQVYDSVLWFDATTEMTLKGSFRSMAEAIFGISDPGVLEGQQILIQVRQWLSDPKNTRWLLIYDNYDDPGQFKIEMYYPFRSHGAIIVTTRRPDLVNGELVRLQPIQDVKESLKILQTRSRREGVLFDPAAKRLAERLDGLPLALATAGAYLSQSTFTFERYLQEYERRWNIDSRRPLQLQEYQDRTLCTTWDLSYTRLESEDPDAAKLLKLLAYFDHQNLWYELFLGGLAEDTPGWLQKVMIDDIEFEGIMRTLKDYCFLEVQTTLQSWSIHACIHDWTFAILNKTIDVQDYCYAFDCVAASIDEDDLDSLGHVKYARLAAHGTFLVQERFRRNKVTENISSHRFEKAFKVSELLAQQVQLEAAEQMYLLTLAGYEKVLGVDHTSTLDTVHNLGGLYCTQGKLGAAEKMYQRALAGYEKALGVDHTSTLDTVDNLGVLYRDQGRLDAAEKMYQRALAGKEKALGMDHTSTLYTVNNLGVLYRDQGAGSRPHVDLHQDHTSTLYTVNNLGVLYRDQGRLDAAEKMYQRALAGYEKALGVDHTSTLQTLVNMGTLLCLQQELSKAESVYQDTVSRFTHSLGPDHIETLGTVNNLANVYCEQGRLLEAEERYEQASLGIRRALGQDHYFVWGVINNCGLLKVEQGNFDVARRMYQEAQAGLESSLGPEHPHTKMVCYNLRQLELTEMQAGATGLSSTGEASNVDDIRRRWYY
ncbi:Tetratricopeptide repeat-containing protein [Cladophialophora immunda]|nr:Tetratricopeptide repeat-containing protein [Cladophialophora immunda]